MSIKDVIEDIEDGCWRNRYSSDVLDDAGEIEEYFGGLEDAAQFVAKYREFYSCEEVFDDPVSYAESWYDSFGSMDGVLEPFE